ncbi:MAG: hypothetical protein JO104_10540 [Candidatus Eremiobacteraeota bacterium]|nr:hypothetical protein [Candidatus Eremiobacteraeota bacterium]
MTPRNWLPALVVLTLTAPAAAMPPNPELPIVIPAWAEGGDREDVDPGAVADRHLFASILDNNQKTNALLASNCPGGGVSRSNPAGCKPYKYVNFIHNHCSSPIMRAAAAFADAADETGFLHFYPSSPSSASNRLTWGATPNRTGPNCPHNPEAVLRMNPGDGKLNAYLYSTVWTGRDYDNDFPPPYGIFEDDSGILAGVIVGGFGQVSTEYGSGTSPSGFADRPGNGPYAEPFDYETAVGKFVNGACGATCTDMALNGIGTGGGDVGPCKVINAGRCHAPYYAGVVDDQDAIANVCSTANRGNLTALNLEEAIYDRHGHGYHDYQTIAVMLNTIAALMNTTTGGCAHTVVVDEEVGATDGTVWGGSSVRLASAAFRFLIPDQATGVPDRVLPFMHTIGKTLAEVPYYFEETLVPAGAEIPVPRFVWNGSAQTAGNGCPTPRGDNGGGLAISVECVGPAAIFCQQYQHLYVNRHDYGKMAACLNSSTATVRIVRRWFRRDPMSSYHYELELAGGEMTDVPYAGIAGGVIHMSACANASFCTGQRAVRHERFAGDGLDTLCGRCGIILFEGT